MHACIYPSRRVSCIVTLLLSRSVTTTSAFCASNKSTSRSCSSFLTSKKAVAAKGKAATAGQVNHWMNKAVGREKRIATLQEANELSTGEEKELAGLFAAGLLYEEQYVPSNFSPEHVAFKAKHNEIFCKLVQHCQAESHSEINIFYLDGPDAATSQALVDTGCSVSQCHVPNRHASTCETLQHWGLPNAVYAPAVEALRENWSDKEFGAYYFDGCGGYTPQIVEMMEAALTNRRHSSPVAIGFSILGGNRDVVDKEQRVIQQLVKLAKGNGMEVRHVLDDPERYGISVEATKIDGGTLTTWCILESSGP